MKVKRSVLLLALFGITALLIAGCGLGDAPSGRIPSADFSRGVALSSDIGGTVGMMVQETGQAISFVWPTATDDQAHIHYQRLDETAQVIEDIDLDLPPGRQRTPRLLAAGEQNLQLFWGNRVPGSQGWTLWQALLTGAGDIVGQPVQLSPEGMDVGDYAAAQNINGDSYVIWEHESDKGFWAVKVTPEGIEPEAVQLTESGSSPGAYVEADGTLHLVWLDEVGINYATFPKGELGQAEVHRLVTFTEIVAEIDGPVVGVADDWVYVLWSVFARTGLEAGSGWTEYIAFPKGEPAPAPTTRIWMLDDEVQSYGAYQGTYALTKLAPAVTSPALSTNYVLEPDPARNQDNELAVAVAAKQGYRLEEYIQMAIILFKDGEFIGYQMAGKTQGFSQDGILQTDTTGNLYIAWREGTGLQLYFASTEPALRDELNAYGSGDYLQLLVGGGLEAIIGVLFFPLSLIWFIPGALLLGIRKLRKDDETANDPSSPIFIAVAILLYQGTKILFLPSVTEYVPFSAWIDVPPGISTMLRIVVPLFSFALGIIIAEIIRRRRDGMSSLLYFFVACGVDAILTLLIYGVNLLGVF